MKNKPPKIAAWLLPHLTKHENKSSIIGDAEEDYKDIRKQKGIIIEGQLIRKKERKQVGV